MKVCDKCGRNNEEEHTPEKRLLQVWSFRGRNFSSRGFELCEDCADPTALWLKEERDESSDKV